jgi:hypothetical protein
MNPNIVNPLTRTCCLRDQLKRRYQVCPVIVDRPIEREFSVDIDRCNIFNAYKTLNA